MANYEESGKDVASLSRDLASISKEIRNQNKIISDNNTLIEGQRKELEEVKKLKQPVIDSLESRIISLKDEVVRQELEKNGLAEKYKEEIALITRKLDSIKEDCYNISRKSEQLKEENSRAECNVRELLSRELLILLSISLERVREINSITVELYKRDSNLKTTEEMNNTLFSLLQRNLGKE